MGERPIRIGILGLGGIVTRGHLPALQARPETFRVTAVARGDPGKLPAAIALTPGARGYGDWRKLIADPDVDAVLIASPNARHAEQALAAIESGKDVLCEKPPALCYAEALRVARTAQKHGRIVQYGFNLRFADETRRACRAIRKGRLGTVYHLRAWWFRRRGFPTKGSWFTTKALSGGGVLADLGSHLLDRLLYLLEYPPVEAVSALTHARLRDSSVEHRLKTPPKSGQTGICDVEDLAVCLVRLAGGVSLVLEASFAANVPETPFGSDLLGDRAGLRLQWGRPPMLYGEAAGAVTDTPLEAEGRSAKVPLTGPLPSPSPMGERVRGKLLRSGPGAAKGNDNLHARQWAHFAECVRARKTPGPNAAQGAALMRVLEAAYRSAGQGREVRIEEVKG